MPQLDHEQPSFRQTTPPPSRAGDDALSREGMEREILAALARHPYLKNTRVLQQPNELPSEVGDYLKDMGLAGAQVKGVYAEGVPYLVAGNLSSVEDGLRTALHEAVGHHGVRALLGEHFEPVMLDLYSTFPEDHEAWSHTQQRYGYLDTGTQAGQVAFAEELTAHMAEQDVQVGEFDMVHAEIRASLRETIPELPVTEKEVLALVQRSRESLILRHGDPESIEEIEARQQRRSTVAEKMLAYRYEQGTHAPDALSTALYRDGSQVLDDEGLPTRLFHGAGGDVSSVRDTLWGSVNPKLANEYAAMRGDMGSPASVVPYYADIKQPFDGDALKNIPSDADNPYGLTPKRFVREVIHQAGLSGQQADDLQEMGRSLSACGRREESGPSYSPKDFWYEPRRTFGRPGADLISDIFEKAGFDGVRYTELGHLTYGAFSPAQLHFLDQGASPRGWQPDRHHGDGPMTERPAFKQWFGDSQVTTPEGEPRVMYHGTTSDISSFDQRKIRPLDLDAECNGFWFSSRGDTSPARKEASNVMPVYLSIQNPASDDLVNDVADEVSDDGYWRPSARSLHDEVRFRLEEKGYDGFFFRNVVSLTAEQKATFERDGEVACVIGKDPVTLRRSNEPEIELAPVESTLDMIKLETPAGTKKANLSLTAGMATLAEVAREIGQPLFSDPHALEVVMEKMEAIVSGEAEGASIGPIHLSRHPEPITELERRPTGNTLDRVDLYDAVSGHCTSYDSLDDLERVVAVAFRPEQIKSAIGNRGTFLQNHPDIRFSLAAPEDSRKDAPAVETDADAPAPADMPPMGMGAPGL